MTSATGSHPFGHNACHPRAEGLAAAVNKAQVAIEKGEVGRGWADGGGNGWRQLNWRGGNMEDCNHKPMIYCWLVSRSGEADTGVKRTGSIISPSILPWTTTTTLKQRSHFYSINQQGAPNFSSALFPNQKREKNAKCSKKCISTKL